MISKLGALLTVGIAAFALAMPTQLHAASASANKKKIAKLKKDLAKLPNKATPVGKIRNILNQLSKLDPKNSAKYLKTGLSKLAPPNALNNAKALQKVVDNNVKRSSLSSGQKNSVIKSAAKVVKGYKPPAPTPTPYQGMTSFAVPAFA